MGTDKTSAIKRKYLELAAVIVCLIIIVAVSLVYANNAEDDSRMTARLSFSVGDKNGASEIHLWFDEENGSYYLFLPSFAELSEIKISCDDSYTIDIGSGSYKNGDSLKSCELGKNYAIKVLSNTGGAAENSTIEFMQSANIPAVFIGTSTGNMNFIHTSKNNEETGTMLLVAEDGRAEYSGELESIKGRGNLTWYSDKKSYNIKLDSESDLLGMGKADGWQLIANASDESYMRNQIVYGFAREAGFAYVPECNYVDLFLNGDYAGLYQLTEKVEIGKHRLDIIDLEEETERVNDTDLDNFDTIETDTAKGYAIENNPANIDNGYLLELELSGQYNEEPSWIITEHDQMIVFRSPEYASLEQVVRIRSLLSGFEDALYADTGVNALGKSYLDYIDAESWAKKYLLDEVFANQDAEWSSQFFYVSNNKMFAGPPWDYDNSLGTDINAAGLNPQTLTALWRGEYDARYRSLYSELYQKDDFYTLVTALYASRFKPCLDRLMETEISEYSSRIAGSAVMDRIRWYKEPQTSAQEAVHSAQQYLQDFLSAKTGFLNSLWIDGKSYCTVSFNGQFNNFYFRYSVPSGQTVGETPLPLRDDYTFAGWYAQGTDVPFDANQPVTSDTAYYAKWDDSLSIKSFVKRNFTFLTYAAIFFGIAVLFFIDRCIQFRKPRRKAKEKDSQTTED